MADDAILIRARCKPLGIGAARLAGRSRAREAAQDARVNERCTVRAPAAAAHVRERKPRRAARAVHLRDGGDIGKSRAHSARGGRDEHT